MRSVIAFLCVMVFFPGEVFAKSLYLTLRRACECGREGL